MTTFFTIIHIIFALLLIILVLVQDSKGNGALGMGGSSNSNSFLGATGAQTFASKLTVWISIFFAATCLTLSALTSQSSKSVLDSLPLPVKAVSPLAPTAPVPASNETTIPAPETSTPAKAPTESKQTD
ncbi:MAG: preprotein translocase subunit SecG [Pseudobdellovibrionaceae bacterium]